ncbi:MAG: dehydrogenase, partial [Candidatus Cloacimonetes bacterium 4572_65]
VTWCEATGSGNAYFTYVYSAQVAEVEIDIKTNKLKVTNIYAAHDVGKAINRELLQGQIYGGVVQGLGMALKEKITIDEGYLTSDNFHKYHIYRANELPTIHDIIIENHDNNSPTGAKGIGEPALEIISPAVANAIYAATGKRYKKLPIDLEV